MEQPSPVEFAPWSTPIENDRLQLVEVVYGGTGLLIDLPPENLRVEVPAGRDEALPTLSARFLSLDKLKIYQISCWKPSAFRVLDEHGLTELWEAGGEQESKRGNSTFRVRNHLWNRESMLSFAMVGEGAYSYLIATDWDCLEIVTHDPPSVELVGDAVVSTLTPVPGH
jgi:hypothetical protein